VRFVETFDEMRAHYGAPGQASLAKVSEVVTPAYRAWIEAAPFCVLATTGRGGLDASPRGDRGAVARVLDPQTIALPDRRGNDRIDSLQNLLADSRVGLLFLLPGSGITIRVNGRARVTVDEEFCESFAIDGKAPRSVLVIRVDEVYFRCARAVMRAGLWDTGSRPDLAALPTIGRILATQSGGAIDGEVYDASWRDRAAATLW
jgi:PPOX class probable FMN-dependent enzyme